ncbi:MAG: tRNA (N(6)-L-threonylcarbamoyladenosine(37)-C(2))-methylthiotransferase MtaB [Actinomycetota bacterium]
MSPKVAFTTLGCRLNQAESDSMAEDLASHGLRSAAPGDAPDVIVVNTCTVTREATKASRMAIRRAIKSHPEAKVVVIGCYAVSNPQEIEAIDGVDVILGNEAKDSLADVLGSQRPTAPLLQIGGLGREPAPVQPRVRANLKLQTGCDEWCSFCIIPTTRGPLKSYDPDDLVREAEARVRAGARELVLTGVHLGKYGYDRGEDERDLVALMKLFLRIEGVWRVRLSSILSRHLTSELIELLAIEPRMCRYLHVPLQAGDDEILRAMNRPYDVAEYTTAIARVTDAIPDIALATDIIVGFPGESEDAFNETVNVVEKIGFSKLHVFRFSPRPDTAADRMTDDVPGNIKRERSKRLIAAGNAIRSRFLRAHIGKRLEVLVEDEREIDGTTVCSGQTDDYVRVWFEGEGLLGAMVSVMGERTRSNGIGGKFLEVLRR